MKRCIPLMVMTFGMGLVIAIQLIKYNDVLPIIGEAVECKNTAIKYKCAQYSPTTGDFEWLEVKK